MSEYSEFFLNSQSSVVMLECLEISHSLFSQTYYVVRNATRGVTVTHEDSSEHDYEYYPLRISRESVRDDLESRISISLGDLGELIPAELDAIREGNSDGDGFSELPIVRYRTYRSDDLENVLQGPLVLEIKEINFTREGSSFEAAAPSLNVSQTGERYAIARFPMLRGTL